MRKATACKICGAPPYHGAYCRPCWRKQEYILRNGTAEGYRPMPASASERCDGCASDFSQTRPRHANYRRLCHSCGVVRHRKYQQDARAKQRRPPSNPIIVAPKTHRAKGQEMAPPAPRIEVKPEKVVVPPHIKVKKVECQFTRFEGRSTIWDERIEG